MITYTWQILEFKRGKSRDSHTCMQVIDIVSFLKVAVDEQAPGYVAGVEVSIPNEQGGVCVNVRVCVLVQTPVYAKQKLEKCMYHNRAA